MINKLVIVDDHRAIRESLCSVLARQTPLRHEVIGQGGTGQEAVDLCLRLHPDVLVLDLALPDFNGVEVLNRLRTQHQSQRVVFFSGCMQRPLIAQAVSLGANGYVLKAQPLQALLDAIDRVSAGGRYFDPKLTSASNRMTTLPAWQSLTSREQEVVRLVAEGKTTKEAATVLGVSAKTLDKHRTNMMRKIGVHDAVSVTRYAIAAGLISLDEG